MKKRALILTGDSLRHSYFIKSAAEAYDLVGVYREKKSGYYEDARKDIGVQRHFEMLRMAEQELIGKVSNVNGSVYESLNDKGCLEDALELKPDIILLFGTCILREHWLDAFGTKIVNLHLGMSPFYRGSATLFWPFYYDELEYLGITVHIAAKRVDSGAILKIIHPSFYEGDTYYKCVTRLLKKAIDVYPQIVDQYMDDVIEPYPQDLTQTKRLCKKSEFSPEILREVLSRPYLPLTQEKIDDVIRRRERCF